MGLPYFRLQVRNPTDIVQTTPDFRDIVRSRHSTAADPSYCDPAVPTPGATQERGIFPHRQRAPHLRLRAVQHPRPSLLSATECPNLHRRGKASGEPRHGPLTCSLTHCGHSCVWVNGSTQHPYTQELLNLVRSTFRKHSSLTRASRDPSLNQVLDDAISLSRLLQDQLRSAVSDEPLPLGCCCRLVFNPRPWISCLVSGSGQAARVHVDNRDSRDQVRYAASYGKCSVGRATAQREGTGVGTPPLRRAVSQDTVYLSSADHPHTRTPCCPTSASEWCPSLSLPLDSDPRPHTL